MTYKRILATLIVKDDKLVKSYGFKFWRPAGSILTALKNLDRWKVDEIVIIDITAKNHVSTKLLSEIKGSKITTPITYGGGIRNAEDINTLLNSGIDRILVETLLFKDQKTLLEINKIIGSQAIVASLPIYFNGTNFISWYHFKFFNQTLLFNELIESLDKNLFSEYLIIDVNNEGYVGKFSMKIFDLFNSIDTHITKHKSIYFGGLENKQANILLENLSTVGVAFGNINLEKELTIQNIRLDILKTSSDNNLRKIRL
jgi:cyclase